MAQKFASIGHIKYAPLLPASELRNVDPEKILRKLRSEVLKQLKKNLIAAPFSKRAKTSLAKSLKIEVKPRSLVMISTHPAFKVFMEGRRRRQMRWLTKAKGPIPIVTDQGKLIFRTATPRSMKDGKWVHPGSEPSSFMEKARDQARAVVKKRLQKDLTKQIAAKLVTGAKAKKR